MQNEHERENDPEEGEYHFSDEGVYETHLEEEEGKAPTIAEKSGLGAQLSSYRRFVIVGGLFAGVLLVVYLVIAPPTTTQPTEITAATTQPQPLAIKTVEVVKAPSLDKKTVTTVTAKAPTPATPPQAVTAPSAVQQLPGSPPVQAVAPLQTIQQELTTAAVSMPAAPTATAPTPPTSAPPLATPEKAVVDRLVTLEESNTKLVAQLNAEYARKLAEFETQDRVLQEQIRALTTKMASMEAQMNQFLQSMNSKRADATVSVSGPAENGAPPPIILPSPQAMASPSPKSSYSVQAIIPGRAWLRAENGDTVTVAEGDVLKGLGRVTKIDPYDGTIQIESSGKVIMLTYGNGDYA